MAESELIPLKEAQKRLGISKTTLWKHVKAGRFTVYENPRDAREKLVDWQEVEEAFRPRPIRTTGEAGPEGKAAA